MVKVDLQMFSLCNLYFFSPNIFASTRSIFAGIGFYWLTKENHSSPNLKEAEASVDNLFWKNKRAAHILGTITFQVPESRKHGYAHNDRKLQAVYM